MGGSREGLVGKIKDWVGDGMSFYEALKLIILIKN